MDRTKTVLNSSKRITSDVICIFTIIHEFEKGKIEHYYQGMKNVVRQDHYYCPEEPTEASKNFMPYNHHERYHKSQDNVTSVDVCFGKRD